jgi:hypothetical protein
VLVYDGGQVTQADDPYLPPTVAANETPSAPRECGVAPPVAAAAAVSVRKALRRAYDAGEIDRATWTGYSDTYSSAKSAWHRLSGKRRIELGAVIKTVNQLAAAGLLTASRMVPAFLELERNTEWWMHTSTTPPPTPTPGTPHKKTACTTAGTIATTGPRVQFKGDPLTYQYYPGNGLRLQPLANWGAANALYNACKGINTEPGTPCEPDALRALLDALIATAVHRGGFLAWEYYFPFGGGKPPWVSGIATGSALSALSHSAELFQEEQQPQTPPAQPTGGTSTPSTGLPPSSPSTGLPPPDPAHYLDIAAQALPVYEHAAPLGIRASGPRGNHYLIYSFDKGLRVGNAFLESLIGLWDFWQATGDKTAHALFVRGDREAKHELPLYDTGAWSLYSLGGGEADLNYQRVIRDFAQGLCDRTHESIYCSHAASFDADLHRPANVSIVGPKTARAKKPTRVAIRVDKISCLSIQILRGQTVVYQPTWYFPRGVHSFTWTPPKPGTYHVHVLARDLMSRQSRADADLRVLNRR